MVLKVSEKLFKSNLESEGKPIVDYKSCVTELRKAPNVSINPLSYYVGIPISCGVMKLFGGFTSSNNAKKN